MTLELNPNTLASWATVAVAATAGIGFIRKGQRWFDKTDERLGHLETGQTKLQEGQASTVAELAEIKAEQQGVVAKIATIEESQAEIRQEQAEIREDQAETKARITAVDAQLRPNGGGSHHDVIRREIREAVREAAEDSGRRRWRR